MHKGIFWLLIKSPRIKLFGHLVDDSVITMDYTLTTKPNGSHRNYGYLFKINHDDIGLLNPTV